MTIAAHHEGIPLGMTERGGKAKIRIHSKESEIPVVAIRSLQEYELKANNYDRQF